MSLQNVISKAIDTEFTKEQLRYKELVDRSNELERRINNRNKDILEIEKTIKAMQEDADRYFGKREDAINQYKVENGKLAKLRGELDQLHEEIKKANAQLEIFKEEQSAIKAQMNKEREKLSDEQNNLSKRKQDVEAVFKKAQSLENDVTARETKISVLKDTLDTKAHDLDDKDKALTIKEEDLKKREEKLAKELESIKQRGSVLADNEFKMRNNIAEFEEAKIKLQETIDKYLKLIEELKRKGAELEVLKEETDKLRRELKAREAKLLNKKDGVNLDIFKKEVVTNIEEAKFAGKKEDA